MARLNELLFALSTETGSVPYVIAAAPSVRGLVRELMPYLLQCCDEKGLYAGTVALCEQALHEMNKTGDYQVEVFAPESDEEDKSGMSFMLQRGTPEIGN